MAEWPPFYTMPYVPFSLGMGVLTILTSDPSERHVRPIGFIRPADAEPRSAECSGSRPCGWCSDCLGVGG